LLQTLWGIDNGVGNSQISNDLGSNWSAANHRMDFRLNGIVVPEPTSFGIIGLTVGALVFVRRRGIVGPQERERSTKRSTPRR